MALLTRLSRLFEADFHAVLDRIEEPELQLRQAVREMQFVLEQDRQRLRLLQHETNQREEAMSELSRVIDAHDRELDICLEANEEDLARDLVRRKLTAEKQLQSHRRQAQHIDSQRRELSSAIEEQSQQFAAMKEKLELLVGHENTAGTRAFNPPEAIRREEIEIALLREKQRRENS